MIDCASLERYQRAHIPGAVGLPVHVWIKETEGGVHVMGSEAFGDLMSQLGVSNDTTVVTYDNFTIAFATRLWWVLKYYGHSNAKVLNGGWRVGSVKGGQWPSMRPLLSQGTPRHALTSRSCAALKT